MLTGDRYRLGRGPVWKQVYIGGLDLPFADLSLDTSSLWFEFLGRVHICLHRVPSTTWSLSPGC